MNAPKTIKIDGTEYVRVPAIPPVPNRVVLVVDRGWIIAGDIVRANGRITLQRALHVFKWESVGFAGMIENTKYADLRRIRDVEIPEASEICCVPVPVDWGLDVAK